MDIISTEDLSFYESSYFVRIAILLYIFDLLYMYQFRNISDPTHDYYHV